MVLAGTVSSTAPIRLSIMIRKKRIKYLRDEKKKGLPVLDPSSMIRMVNGPREKDSPAVAGTKFMGTFGMPGDGVGPSASTEDMIGFEDGSNFSLDMFSAMIS